MEKEKTLYEVIRDFYDSVVNIVFTIFL